MAHGKDRRQSQLPPHMQNGSVPQFQGPVPIIGGQQHKPLDQIVDGINTPLELEPLHDAIMVRKLDFTQRMGSLVIPDNADTVFVGEVIKAGPGRWSDVMEWRPPVELEPGDVVVLIGSGAGARILCGTEEVFCFDYRHLRLKLTKEKVALLRAAGDIKAAQAGPASPPEPTSKLVGSSGDPVV